MGFISNFFKAIRKTSVNSPVAAGLYEQEFFSASALARSFKLNVPNINLQSRRFISDQLLQKLPEHIHEHVGELTPEMLVTQCFFIHSLIKDPIEKLFGTEAYFTLGYVELEKRNLFYHDETYLSMLLKKGIQNPQLNLHAWITLSSMEIIDFSLSTSYAYVNGDYEKSFGIIACHPDELKGHMKYHPTLVGDDFLKQIGAIQDIFMVSI
ncbi:MAG: hypothetical protein EOO53_11865 [Gammaproteobacteria bacterium]|nr:MAG: hypothetical protein EOO53_11865 [Gammaproteobacteria bacterium]